MRHAFGLSHVSASALQCPARDLIGIYPLTLKAPSFVSTLLLRMRMHGPSTLCSFCALSLPLRHHTRNFCLDSPLSPHKRQRGVLADHDKSFISTYDFRPRSLLDTSPHLLCALILPPHSFIRHHSYCPIPFPRSTLGYSVAYPVTNLISHLPIPPVPSCRHLSTSLSPLLVILAFLLCGTARLPAIPGTCRCQGARRRALLPKCPIRQTRITSPISPETHRSLKRPPQT